MAKKTTLCGLFTGLFISFTVVAQNQSKPNYTIYKDTITFSIGTTDADMAVLDAYPEFRAIAISGPWVWSGPEPRSIKWPLTDAGIAHLASCPNLQKLQINTNYTIAVTDDGLKVLEKLTKLQSVNFMEQRFSDAGMKHLAALHDLEELELDGSPNLGDGTLETVGALTKLRVLRFHKSPLTDAGILKIAHLSELENLQLGYALVGDEALKTIGTFKKLKTLDLQHTKVTDTGLPALKDLNLHWLCLNGTEVTTLAPLAGMKEIEWLFVDGTKVDDRSIDTIAGMKSLVNLYLSDTRVTSALLPRLIALEKLENLKLNGLPITDEAIDAMLAMKSLKSVELNRTKVTENGIARLAQKGIVFNNRER